MKKFDEFKEEMTQKFMQLLLKMLNVDSGKISKKLGKLSKTVQNMHDKCTKDTGYKKSIVTEF